MHTFKFEVGDLVSYATVDGKLVDAIVKERGIWPRGFGDPVETYYVVMIERGTHDTQLQITPDWYVFEAA